MKLADLLRNRTAVPRVGIRGTPEDAATILERRKCGAVVIVENESLAGIVTQRDLIRYYCYRAAGSRPATLTKIMHRPVVTALPEDDLHLAVQIMKTSGARPSSSSEPWNTRGPSQPL